VRRQQTDLIAATSWVIAGIFGVMFRVVLIWRIGPFFGWWA